MKYLSFLLLILTILLPSCGSVEKTSADSFEKRPVRQDKYCGEWQERFDKLTEKDKKSFEKEKIIQSDYGYLLSKDLVKDCKLRLEIGKLIRKALSADYSEEDKNFAVVNSKEIVKVLRKIWDSPNYASDGAGPDEKFALLYSRGLDGKDIDPFVGELLEAEGFFPSGDGNEFYLSPNLHWILFNHPKPAIDNIVLKRLKISEEKKDLLEQITALVILNKNSPKKLYLEKLNQILQNNLHSQDLRKSLKTIIDRFEKGEKVEFQQLDKLLTKLNDSEGSVRY